MSAPKPVAVRQAPRGGQENSGAALRFLERRLVSIAALVGLLLPGQPAQAALQQPLVPHLLATGFDGLESITLGPGGAFGDGLYVSSLGTSASADGRVDLVDPHTGARQVFLSGIDAASVAFDTTGLLGGGMFVADYNDNRGAGKVWRIRPGAGAPPPAGAPVLAVGAPFTIDLFANLSSLGRLKAFQLTIHDAQDGFAAGLYLTSGPAAGDRGDRIVRLDGNGVPTVVASGLLSNESLVFAQSAYGQGLLVAEPLNQRILRLASDGTRNTFADLGTAPFGPAMLAWTAAGELLVTDYSSGAVLHVLPDGSDELAALLPLPGLSSQVISRGAKATRCSATACFFGVYTAVDTPDGSGSLYVSSAVPEPAAALLLAAGLGLLGLHRRRGQ